MTVYLLNYCCTAALLSLAFVENIKQIFIRAAPHLAFRNRKIAKKILSRRPPRHEASTTDADPGRVGKVDQGDARARNSAARGRPQLELSRKQLKIGSKSEPSAASYKRHHIIGIY